MHELWRQHPGLACVLIALIFFLIGCSNYKSGYKLLACGTWFLGVVTVSGGISGSCLFIGRFRWPIATMVFIAGTYALWRFMRNKI